MCRAWYSGSMRLIITRHGQTHENSQKISMGQSIDGSLSKEGIDQAKKLANRLKKEKIDFVYVSDLKRALNTADEILKFHPSAKKVINKDLRERSLGVYEGKPNNLWKNAMKESSRSFSRFKPKNGESYLELKNRTKKFFDLLLKKHIDDNVLVVSHTGTSTMLIMNVLHERITQTRYEHYRPKNTALTVFEISKDRRARMRLINDISHLKNKYYVYVTTKKIRAV